MRCVTTFKKLFTAALLLLTSHQAMAVMVDVQPKRIIFERSRTSAQVTLANESDKPVTYEISLVNLHADENGKLSTVDDNTTEVASNSALYATAVPGLLSVYPNRPLTLKPRESRVIKLWVRRPADLKPGEYRSHLKIQESENTHSVARNEENLSVAIRLLTSVTIPVMVRHEVEAGQAGLSGLTLYKGKGERYRAKFNATRSGQGSIVGDFRMTFTPSGGTPVDAGRMKGSVFAPLAVRHMEFDLSDDVQKLLANGVKGTLTVRVFDEEKKNEKTRRSEAVLAELSIEVK